MRINKYIARTGYCSRRKADRLISQGRVKINGKVLDQAGYQVKHTDRVEIDDEFIELLADKKYYLFNKPIHVLSSHDDPHHEHFIYDYLPEDEGLFSVGRLDFDSEGLMIITNDGDFANIFSHPSYEIEKEYLVVLDKDFKEDDQSKILSGISVGDENFRVNDLIYFERKSWQNLLVDLDQWQEKYYRQAFTKRLVQISLHEGKNREVRRIFKALGYQVLRLVRIRIDSLKLKGIPSGSYKEMDPVYIEKIQNKNFSANS